MYIQFTNVNATDKSFHIIYTYTYEYCLRERALSMKTKTKRYSKQQHKKPRVHAHDIQMCGAYIPTYTKAKDERKIYYVYAFFFYCSYINEIKEKGMRRV